jgi:hypothetical protein
MRTKNRAFRMSRVVSMRDEENHPPLFVLVPINKARLQFLIQPECVDRIPSDLVLVRVASPGTPADQALVPC